MQREFIVVGAGPAGASAAATLARRGRDVLLVDRSDFPRDKVCGDGIPPGTVALLDGLGMGERVRSAGFHPIHAIRLGSPRGRTWETRFQARRPGLEFYVAPRVRFDALIFDHARACGAEFQRAAVAGVLRDNERVAGVRLRDDGGEHDVTAGMVIAADGATSVVAREVGADKPPREHRFVAIRAYADGVDVDPDRVEFYFDRRFVPGYGWVFPLGASRANVGVIMRADRYRDCGATLRALLDEFLEMPVLGGRFTAASVTDVASWQLPIAVTPWRRRAFPGALLAGDAGGFIDPLTGEGIHFAVASGIIAGEVAAEGSNDYDRRCRGAMGALVERSYRIHRWVAGAPRWLEFLFAAGNAGPGLVRRVLNRISEDFITHA